MTKAFNPFEPSDAMWHIKEASCFVRGVHSPLESISPAAEVLTNIKYLGSHYLTSDVFQSSKLLRV